MHGLAELREQGKIRWIDEQHAWAATPEDVVDALANDGFEECKRATTTSRRDLRPVGGVWQGVNRHTGGMASTTWVERPSAARAIVFITIDGEAVTLESRLDREPDSHTEDGGEG
jgi:hypothetical protein